MVFKKTKKPLKEEQKATKTFARSQPSSPKNTFETKETQFWNQVSEHSKSLIADLIETILPLSANALNLEKDEDYQSLLRSSLSSYFENEEYQEKITSNSWTEEDIEEVSQELTVAYWEIVVRTLIAKLNHYPSFEQFENSLLSQLED